MPKYAPTLPSARIYRSPFGLIEWCQFNPRRRPQFLERFVESWRRLGRFQFESYPNQEWVYALVSSFSNFYAGERRKRRMGNDEFALLEEIHQELEDFFGEGYNRVYWEIARQDSMALSPPRIIPMDQTYAIRQDSEASTDEESL